MNFSGVGNNNISVVNNFYSGSVDSKAVAKELLTGLEKLFTSFFDEPQGGILSPFTTDIEQPQPSLPPAPVEAPILEESSQPEGSLKTSGNKVTTAGGYTIEVLGTSEWKITGPDGKNTRIWGDPHVHEGDREGGTAEGNGGWDFKRNSTFVLGDGTKINVTCVPGGAAGATVTGKLEIISGNDRVEVSDMEKGMGKMGTVTQDGYAKANSFQGDVFVQGREADDWSFEGKEIVGSEGMGEKFKTGDTLAPPTRGMQKPGAESQRGINDLLDRFRENFSNFGRSLMDIFRSSFQPSPLGSNPYTGTTRAPWENDGGKRYDRAQHRQNLTRSLQDMSRMFGVLAKLSQLSDQLQAMRSRFNATLPG